MESPDDKSAKHLRAKSGIARSLLNKVSSRSDMKESASSAASAKSDAVSTAPSSISKIPSLPTGSPARPTKVTSASAAPASIEQSVRLFRLYEVLRSGDTAAIGKIIKGPNANPLEPGRRPSATTLTDASSLEGTTILHLAVQCADLAVIEYVLSNSTPSLDLNARDKDGNTPLHIASQLSRAPVVTLLLSQQGLNDSIVNYHGKSALDLAKNPEIFQQLQLARSVYIDGKVKEIQGLVASGDYDKLEEILGDTQFQNTIDVNGPELATDAATTQQGGTLLHEAARKKDSRLIQILLLNGADPFRRDRKGKLPQDITKDDKTKTILRKSPAAAAAQRGIQEKTVLGSGGSSQAGSTAGEPGVGGKEAREMKGYLKKWTNYTSGYKLRWFVLEDGVMSYYKHQDDAGSACRGAINMKIATLHMDAQDKLRFEVHGKSSVKYHLKANHQIEAKRWFWALNNAIQWSKDEAKEEQKRTAKSSEVFRQAKSHAERLKTREGAELVPGSSTGLARASLDDDAATSAGDPSVMGDDVARAVRANDTQAIDGDLDNDEEYGDDASSVQAQPVTRDAFMIAAQSARIQLDLLAQITTALQAERTNNPGTTMTDPSVVQALGSYESAVANLKGLVGDLGRIARDRESFWHYRLEQEVNVRRMWEDSMAKLAKEQEELEQRIEESEDKRKRTKRALKDVMGSPPQTPAQVEAVPAKAVISPASEPGIPVISTTVASPTRPRTTSSGLRKQSTLVGDISDSDEDEDDEFFDAVGAGVVEVVEDLPESKPDAKTVEPVVQQGKVKAVRDLKPSFKGYEDPVRTRLKMDDDNRPKISLWGILKSMIGKDMTKMTLPVSFNEPTSLLQRVAEDMEYTDLIDEAASRADSTERMVYIAAFAVSEYASTIGRVAKPFNPLLGETYEYCRPDKGFRFFIEQVSHHPPVGAAWAESENWDYYGESAVKSKFYGKSFDINPLGTWFLRLRPKVSAGAEPVEELYTWKKVTSSVIGIITGSPTVDNYGPMEIKNHTTGEVCILDFKARGWKASSAYQVSGKVLDATGTPRWSLGGRWSEKLYARLTPGYEAPVEGPSKAKEANQAFLVWEAHGRPTGIPFNLTPFVVTLNAVPDALRAHLPHTDTRLRPDQRAMEDGEYDLAATEKNRVEEKQRAARRAREADGEEYEPKWFKQETDPTTGEVYWQVTKSDEGRPTYWEARDRGDWSRAPDIF